MVILTCHSVVSPPDVVALLLLVDTIGIAEIPVPPVPSVGRLHGELRVQVVLLLEPMVAVVPGRVLLTILAVRV
jgi:hypothetical protein